MLSKPHWPEAVIAAKIGPDTAPAARSAQYSARSLTLQENATPSTGTPGGFNDHNWAVSFRPPRSRSASVQRRLQQTQASRSAFLDLMRHEVYGREVDEPAWRNADRKAFIEFGSQPDGDYGIHAKLPEFRMD